MIGTLLIIGGMQFLSYALKNTVEIAAAFGGFLLIWGLACVALGVGVYYGRRGAVGGARLMASMMILMLAIVLVFQWNAREGPDQFVFLTLLLIVITSVWLWLVIRAQQLVRNAV